MKGKWIAKAVIQKGLSFLPDPQRANYFFQHHVTRSTTLSDDFLTQRIGWASMHLSALRDAGSTPVGMLAIELGTGWYPIIPLCYYLAGAEKVLMVDLEDLTRPELVIQAARGLVEAAHDDRLYLSVEVDPDRLDHLESMVSNGAEVVGRDALEEIGLQSVPGDARSLETDRVPQLISSNTVFEHIPPDVLEGILGRFRDIAGERTVMSHLIDHCDHYAYIDDNVGVYHFLRYSDLTWRIINNTIQPMNRLRASEYVEMYRRVGISIDHEHHLGCDASALDGVPLAARFVAMDATDVSCTASHLVTTFG